MNLLHSAAQAFFVYASCCNPASSLSPQDMQSQPSSTANTSPLSQPAKAKA
jgi:hypothetical protein